MKAMIGWLPFAALFLVLATAATIAKGKISAQAVTRSLVDPVLAGKRSEIHAGLAPAHGLTLVEVTYPSSIPESIGQ